ncbi:MAG: 50S ribosomal protein L4 [Azonexus sp.]|nr:50S ribosomal protein L4 [Azonexus sp.]MCK6413793.1 50S ribosomal protein L4 [Azonexus sp.]
MELKVINEQGQEAAKLEASDILFAREFNEALVHQIVVAYQANGRAGNRKQKDRSEVKHTTTKPWRQKGTGRARAGSNGSPLWRGGGRIFPNSPEENFTQKVNKKMFRAGMASILSELARQDRLVVVEDIAVDAPKTKLFSQKLKNMGLEGNLLVVTDVLNENLYLSSRNLPNVLVLEAQEADPVSLVRFGKVVVTKSAVAKFEEMWG